MNTPQASPRVKRAWNFDLVFGLVLLGVSVFSALLAPLIAPLGSEAMNLADRLKPPGVDGHLFGTDAIGRDILARIPHGGRISLTVGFVSVAVSLIVGVGIGLLAGFYRGVLDMVLMRIADVQLSFPFILLAITVIAVIGPGLWKLIFVMALTQWVQYARMVRGQVLSLREQDAVQATRALGASDARIVLRHMLPNLIGPVIVLATLNVANNILLESGLTFLGLGIDPLIPSWGGMLADGRNYMQTAWWVATFPGLAITVTVLGFNLLGDWLRDRLDPLDQGRGHGS